jgi:hypothetical protein
MKARKIFVFFGVRLAWVSSRNCQSTNLSPNPAVSAHRVKSDIKPIGNWQVAPAEKKELSQIFASATADANAIAPSLDAGAQHQTVHNALRAELEVSSPNIRTRHMARPLTQTEG